MKRNVLIICIILLLVIMSMALFACDSDEEFNLLDIYVNRESVGEFFKDKCELVASLPKGYKVNFGHSNKLPFIHQKTAFGYSNELNGVFVYHENFIEADYGCLDFLKDGKTLLFKNNEFEIIQMQVYYGNIFLMTHNGKILVYDYTNSKWFYDYEHPLYIMDDFEGEKGKSITDFIHPVSKNYFVTKKSMLTYAHQFPEKVEVPNLEAKKFFVFSSNGNMIGRVLVGSERIGDIEGFDSYLVIQKNKVGSNDAIEIVSFDGFTKKSDELISPQGSGVFNLHSGNGEVTYFGNGIFLIHMEEKGTKEEYFYKNEKDEYWNVARYIFNAKDFSRRLYRSDIMMLSIENEYYQYSTKKDLDTSQFLRKGYSYVTFGMVRDPKTKEVEYDRFIIKNTLNEDGTFEIVHSLTTNYGKLQGQYAKLNSEEFNKISLNELLMSYVDDIGVVQVGTGILNIYDKYGNKIGSNSKYNFQSATYNCGVILCTVLNESISNPSKYDVLYGAVDITGKVVVPFEYTNLTMFTGYYAIGTKQEGSSTSCYIVAQNGYSVPLADKNGIAPEYNFHINKGGALVYKTGCYVYTEKVKDETFYGIKSTNIINGKNILFEAKYKYITLYPNGGFGEVYAQLIDENNNCVFYRLR